MTVVTTRISHRRSVPSVIVIELDVDDAEGIAGCLDESYLHYEEMARDIREAIEEVKQHDNEQ